MNYKLLLLGFLSLGVCADFCANLSFTGEGRKTDLCD